MTIAILKLEAGQTIPRPFSRASSQEELVELVCRALATKEAASQNMGFMAQIRYTEANWERFDIELNLAHIDTERAIAEIDGTRFYAFVEA